MFTVCPKCALTLTVTAADLRVAQGFVRCGQCTNVFNALVGLSDERQPASAPPQEPVLAPSPAVDPVEEDPPRVAIDAPPPDEGESSAGDGESTAADSGSAADDGASLVIDELAHADEEVPAADEDAPLADDASIEQTSLEFNPDAADVSQIFIEPETIADDAVTGTYESIVLGTPESSRAESEPEPEAVRNADDELNEQLESLAARIDAARQNQLAQTHTGLQPLIEPFGAPPRAERTPARAHLWIAALVGLSVLLIGQAVNHYRDDLAVNTRLHRPLTALYAAFGVELVPRWDLAAYEVHQLGASAPAQTSGALTVRASIRNDAAQPQPLPLLRVTLLDRFGKRLASRDVPPQAYMVGTPSTGVLLPAGERVDAQMAFVDPGRDAVGFEIDACLPAVSARVHCANDAAAQ
jgi:predicted Zn finger-like uncharacterized protein